MLKNQSYPFRHKGFTLIELIAVIILISILSVSVFSRFSGTSGFAEFTYQARLVSALRNMQTRAMHDNREGYCFKINFDLATPAFGPPTLNHADNNANPDDTCSTDIDHDNVEYLTTTESEMTDADITLKTEGDSASIFAYIQFDNMGRPSADGVSCSTSCKITFTGESNVSVCIESQGYIHACD